MKLATMIAGVLFLWFALAALLYSQSASLAGSAKLAGSSQLNALPTEAPAMNIAKCEAYLVDAGLESTTFVDSTSDYEQVGIAATCFGPSFDDAVSRDEFN